MYRFYIITYHTGVSVVWDLSSGINSYMSTIKPLIKQYELVKPDIDENGASERPK